MNTDHGTVIYSKWDALDMAENRGMVVELCATCGGWHFRDAASEEEADKAGAEYRSLLAKQFPSLAKQRGW
jgi:hypothetical protein